MRFFSVLACLALVAIQVNAMAPAFVERDGANGLLVCTGFLVCQHLIAHSPLQNKRIPAASSSGSDDSTTFTASTTASSADSTSSAATTDGSGTSSSASSTDSTTVSGSATTTDSASPSVHPVVRHPTTAPALPVGAALARALPRCPAVRRPATQPTATSHSTVAPCRPFWPVRSPLAPLLRCEGISGRTHGLLPSWTNILFGYLHSS
ncbi:hypothetical protein FKP32DRAFT_1021408 [Trametes sanguinea]|nr:hypothetical protein FKP32DRAFT_1021408 [Trametes sanguinea]